jgi:DNA-binding response OmpR family regulator
VKAGIFQEVSRGWGVSSFYFGNSESSGRVLLLSVYARIPMHTLSSGRVRFGAFELDLSTGELRSIEAPDPNNKVLLREQVFQILRMLLEREGKIVTREEIKGRLWPADTVVDFDRSINATIFLDRDSAGSLSLRRASATASFGANLEGYQC